MSEKKNAMQTASEWVNGLKWHRNLHSGDLAGCVFAEDIEARDRDVRQDERRIMAERVTPEAEAFIDKLVSLPWDGNDARWWPRVRTMIQALIDSTRRQALVDAVADLETLCGNELFTRGVLVAVRRLRSLIAHHDAEAKHGG